VPGGSIAGWQVGAGPAVLLLHGGPSQTFTSIAQHFENKTLQHRLASLTLPTVVLLGADSPIPPKHGIATAALIPGASHRIEPECGHFPWLKHGSVRTALDTICRQPPVVLSNADHPDLAP
jgi:hypothetical protein